MLIFSLGNSLSLSTIAMTVSSSGTATIRNVDLSTLLGSTRRLAYVSYATPNLTSGIFSSTLQFYRGAWFYAVFKWNSVGTTSSIHKIGFSTATSAFAANSPPNTERNVLLFGAGSWDLFMHSMQNDARETPQKSISIYRRLGLINYWKGTYFVLRLIRPLYGII